MQVHEVFELVNKCGLEVHKNLLIRNANEDRLHRRITDLEATILSMSTQSARHTGMKEKLINPNLHLARPNLQHMGSISPQSIMSSSTSDASFRNPIDFGLSLEKRYNDKVFVTDVTAGTLAERCGVIQIGDEIKSINEEEVGVLELEEIYYVILHLLTLRSAIRLRLRSRDLLTGGRSVHFIVEISWHGSEVHFATSFLSDSLASPRDHSGVVAC